MEEHKVTDNRLYIPENVPLRWELFRGFGFRELMQSAVIVAAAAVGALLYYKFSSSPMRVITALVIVLAAGVIAAGLFSQQANHLSIYTYAKYAYQFGRSQKRYDDIKAEEVVYEKT